jgi:cysteine desulfurase
MRKVYLDYSATTPVKKEVLDTMIPYFMDHFGNASSVHQFGRATKTAVMTAREQIAKTLNASPEEIFFTAGGTESDNWALIGTANANKAKGNHIITTSIEHHAILHTCDYLKTQGFDITVLEVDEFGLISLEALEKAMTDKTIIVSIMYINNEIGTKQDIEAIGKLVKSKGAIFHTDAVQAYGNVMIDVKKDNIDLLSISAHKVYGPKGIGALFIKKGVKIAPFIHGGGQERKRRAGTENVPGIMGFGKAAELAYANFDEHVAHCLRLREKLKNAIIEKVPYVKFNGHPTERHPGNVNFCFEFIEGESLLLSLDILGIAGSSGSACTSGSLDPSHVLMAIGLTHEIAHGSLRLSIGDMTTDEDIEYTVTNLAIIVDRLRQMSPLYEKHLEDAKNV